MTRHRLPTLRALWLRAVLVSLALYGAQLINRRCAP
jgi:hypothetical protein